MNRADKMLRGYLRISGRPFEGLGLLFALVLALIATVVVLVAPGRQWGPEMWPFYFGTMGILLWVAFDVLWKLRDRPADAEDAPADAQDTDMLVRDAAEYPNPEGGTAQVREDLANHRGPTDRPR
jgi:hypothetical protein